MWEYCEENKVIWAKYIAEITQIRDAGENKMRASGCDLGIIISGLQCECTEIDLSLTGGYKIVYFENIEHVTSGISGTGFLSAGDLLVHFWYDVD